MVGDVQLSCTCSKEQRSSHLQVDLAGGNYEVSQWRRRRSSSDGTSMFHGRVQSTPVDVKRSTEVRGGTWNVRQRRGGHGRGWRLDNITNGCCRGPAEAADEISTVKVKVKVNNVGVKVILARTVERRSMCRLLLHGDVSTGRHGDRSSWWPSSSWWRHVRVTWCRRWFRSRSGAASWRWMTYG